MYKYIKNYVLKYLIHERYEDYSITIKVLTFTNMYVKIIHDRLKSMYVGLNKFIIRYLPIIQQRSNKIDYTC